MAINRLPGTRINAKLTLNKPDGSPYDLTTASNYLIYAYVRPGRIIAQFSREAIDGYTLADETGLDPSSGETRIIIEGSKTKDLKDTTILLVPYIQFDDAGTDFMIGADDGKSTELATITTAPQPEPPAV